MHSEYWETAAKNKYAVFSALHCLIIWCFFRKSIGRSLPWAERGVPDTVRNFPGANVYTVPCPIIHALNLIGGKWKLPVLWHLFDAESVRYNELKRSVVGITNIMLTQCLRELEAAGLVRRNDFGEVPPRVEYSLTGRAGNCSGPARTLQMGREAACPHRRGRSAFLLSRFAAFSRIASPFHLGHTLSCLFSRPESVIL